MDASVEKLIIFVTDRGFLLFFAVWALFRAEKKLDALHDTLLKLLHDRDS